MHQSSMLYVGMDVHKAAIAVAYVAKDHEAEGISLGPFGLRQCDLDSLIRKRQSKAKHLVFVSAAGPCGSWLSRYLTNKDSVCWVVAPSCIPTKAGDQVNTDRRDARHLARFMRSGDLPPRRRRALGTVMARSVTPHETLCSRHVVHGAAG